jgi:hypothetical protein
VDIQGIQKQNNGFKITNTPSSDTPTSSDLAGTPLSMHYNIPSKLKYTTVNKKNYSPLLHYSKHPPSIKIFGISSNSDIFHLSIYKNYLKNV